MPRVVRYVATGETNEEQGTGVSEGTGRRRSRTERDTDDPGNTEEQTEHKTSQELRKTETKHDRKE